MKFFVPQADPAEYDQVYQAIADSIKSQLGWKLAERRIYRLRRLQGKKTADFVVGELDPQENSYQILAILESNAFVVFTRGTDGRAGTTILVDKAEVTEVSEFETAVVKQ